MLGSVKGGYFLTSCAAFGFSKLNLLRRVI